MTINIAHLRTQGISFVVAQADVVSHQDGDRSAFLARIAAAARRSGLRVDKAALAFSEWGRPTYYGTPDLVRFLARSGVPRWTHTVELD